MTMQSPVQPPAMLAERRRLQQSDRSQQIDLFDGVTPTQTPAWRDLPEETRATLTGLMARLILESKRLSAKANLWRILTSTGATGTMISQPYFHFKSIRGNNHPTNNG